MANKGGDDIKVDTVKYLLKYIIYLYIFSIV